MLDSPFGLPSCPFFGGNQDMQQQVKRPSAANQNSEEAGSDLLDGFTQLCVGRPGFSHDSEG